MTLTRRSLRTCSKSASPCPYGLSVHLDSKDSTRYVFDVQQDGLGLPDRDYYLRDDATALRLIRRQYQAHICRLVWQNSATRTHRRKPLLSSHSKPGLPARSGERPTTWMRRRSTTRWSLLRWDRSLRAMTGTATSWPRASTPKVSYLILSQPSYLQGFGQLLTHTALSTWKAYFRWHVLSDFAPYLSQAYVDAAFAFYGTVLQGVPENQPRWKRGLTLVDQSIGQGLGKLYVEKYFSQQGKIAGPAAGTESAGSIPAWILVRWIGWRRRPRRRHC